MRHCGNCGKPGHYKSTCPERSAVKPPQAVKAPAPSVPVDSGRTCSRCHKSGHNKATCTTPEVNPNPEPGADELVPEKYRILEEMRGPKVDRPQLGDLKAERGLYIVSEKRKRVAGRILKVRRNGTIVWTDFSGHEFCNKSSADTLKRADYAFSETLPEGEDWKYQSLGSYYDAGSPWVKFEYNIPELDEVEDDEQAGTELRQSD